jgi:hypothetical protein
LAELIFFNLKLEVFGHLVLVDHPANAYANLVRLFEPAVRYHTLDFL